MPLPRKWVEPRVLAIEGADEKAVRALPQLVSEGAWEDAVLLGQHGRAVAQDLGEAEGVLRLEGRAFHQQGKESVGVKRQYGGAWGKRANGPAGVLVGYSRAHGYALLDRRLNLPREWVEDVAYAERRAQGGVPPALTFKTQLELGLEMLTAIHDAKSLRCQWVMGDEGLGREGPFLDRLAALDLGYFAEVPQDTRVWSERPVLGRPVPSAKGRKLTKERAQTPPETVLDIATALSPERWTGHTLKEGSQGPLIADFAVLRVVGVRDAWPGPDVGRVMRPSVSTGQLKTYRSNAPSALPVHRRVWASGRRWPSESCFEEGKPDVGLGDYEIRSWRGWHHPMTLCILAHFFLVRLAVRLKKVSMAHYSPSPDAFVTDVTPLSLKPIPQSGPRLLLATPHLARLSLIANAISPCPVANPVRHQG